MQYEKQNLLFQSYFAGLAPSKKKRPGAETIRPIPVVVVVLSDDEPAEVIGNTGSNQDTGDASAAQQPSVAQTHDLELDHDLDELLGGDEDDDDADVADSDKAAAARSSSSSFAPEEIVWELWHRGNRRPVTVRDEDLLAAPDAAGRPVVFAQLALVTSVQKVKKQGLMLGLLTLTDGMGAEAFSLDRPARLVAARSVRKFGTYVQDQLILRSQQSATHFLILKSIVEDAESYTFLHRQGSCTVNVRCSTTKPNFDLCRVVL
jgi:hypothetical protein